MLTKYFNFDLPTELIALRPIEPRDAARLMVIHPSGRLEHRHFFELPQMLIRGDTLVFNDTRVIQARLKGTRPARLADGPAVQLELTLHRRTGASRFLAFVRPARRLRSGDQVVFAQGITARVLERRGGEAELDFNLSSSDLDKVLAKIGVIPLPPYIAKKRPPDGRDSADYQTVYARQEGSIAAPTAGLHFTQELLSQLAEAGIGRADLTLHIGPGTFLPVEAEDTAAHVMHSESVLLDAGTAEYLNGVRAVGGRIVAVGTTVLRTLETVAADDGTFKAFSGETDIFITPGYRFRTVDMLVTNFHLPRSTLFMLVSAFMGLNVMQQAYAEAISQKYRFYSYGDACLLIRAL